LLALKSLLLLHKDMHCPLLKIHALIDEYLAKIDVIGFSYCKVIHVLDLETMLL